MRYPVPDGLAEDPDEAEHGEIDIGHLLRDVGDEPLHLLQAPLVAGGGPLCHLASSH